MVEEKLLGKARYHWFVYVKMVFGFLLMILPVILAIVSDFSIRDITRMF